MRIRPNRRPPRCSAPPTCTSGRPSSACSSSRCRRRPRSSTSSSRRCCAIRFSSSRPRETRCAMRCREDELNRFGEELGRALRAPAVIGLSGDLGTGKTTLVQAICRGLGARALATSPTYALVHHYEAGGRSVYHVDCYRLRSPDEAQELGFEDMLREDAIILVEWPERAGPWVPPLERHFKLSYSDDSDSRE